MMTYHARTVAAVLTPQINATAFSPPREEARVSAVQELQRNLLGGHSFYDFHQPQWPESEHDFTSYSMRLALFPAWADEPLVDVRRLSAPSLM
jgi:hypothetical protein